MIPTIPVLLAPANLTKHLKVFLDKIQWREKSKLIARYTQISVSQTASGDQSTFQHNNNNDNNSTQPLYQDGHDLTLYMAMALLPVQALASIHNPGENQRISLWHILQDPSSPLASLEWPESLSDPSAQKSIFLTWMHPNTFATPRHLLAQTPLEKLQKSIADFLTPFLQSWANEKPTCDNSNDKSNNNNNKNDQLSLELLPQLIASISQKWEHYSDFTLLPPSSFLTPPWPVVLKQLEEQDQAEGHKNGIMARWESLIQEALNSSHIARKAIIPVHDVLRRPQIRPLTGDWRLHNQYKAWVEQDQGLLEHQDIGNTLGKDDANACSNDLANTTPGNADTTAPTKENFSQAYWAETCQNHVWYRWAPMFTMFSAGNITEKERVAKSRPIFDARGKTVVDLYAGIGYFALVYLVHAGAKTVHACEWNPWSVQGLLQGAIKNEISYKVYHGGATGFADQNSKDQRNEQSFEHGHVSRPSHGKKPKEYGQLVVYPGDNSQWIGFFENQAHHINLGLIPSAEPGWVLGVRALCPKEGGYLHVHHNIRVGEEETFKSYLLKSLHELFANWKQDSSWSLNIRHMENVKSFAPMVFHYVVDVECRPQITLSSSIS
ncbi:tRNA methyltransferase tyw3 [Entomortierella chlamydospora]|uniref:tRNA(Phe) (4-demethylwyosine(37)-C(7)) aminocarboxypropyltransferase n=1 Tax=Entomortierella chlamydospora TaxID=101097 RepID=A0A9P6T474_9FUNG|nr:tRNA methyltransferase tyw3 [Entomortierella chlamydospora]KAG0023617.1 tRNA methyltransferase tyw3 [Entomortierella chlamydospora]